MSKAEDIAQKKELAVNAAEILYHYKLIARSVGVTDDTLKHYRDKDPDFSERLEQGRVRFLEKHMRKSKPEFLLERMEKEIFSQKLEVVNDRDPVEEILKAYGLMKEGGNDRQVDGTIPAPSTNQTQD